MPPYRPFVHKYRPSRFDELVGQEQVVELLKSAFREGAVAPAYLFSGPHGVGKTSTARIFAKLINCLNPVSGEPCNQCEMCQEIGSGNSLDVIEIDAASNRRIEEVRQLRENVKFAPVKAKYKVYIIDEVHMLTLEAFNALLKTLEEPPAHVKFILATTHPHKLPPTIMSRCQRVEFSKARDSAIRDYIMKIAEQEKISLDDRLISTIVSRAKGSFRDAAAFLEQVAVVLASSDMTVEDLLQVIGMGEETSLVKAVLDGVLDCDVPAIVKAVDRVVMEALDLESFVERIEQILRGSLLAKHQVDKDLWRMEEEYQAIVEEIKDRLDLTELFYMLQIIIRMKQWLRTGVLDRLALELGFVKMAYRTSFVPVERAWSGQDRRVSGAGEVPASSKKESLSVSSSSSSEVHPTPRPKEARADEGARGRIPDFWRKILVELMRSRNMFLGHILQDVHSVGVKDDTIEVVFSQKFSFESMKDEKNIKTLKALIKNLLGKDYRLKFALAPRPRVEEKDHLLEERLKVVLNTFGGKVIERGRLRRGDDLLS